MKKFLILMLLLPFASFSNTTVSNDTVEETQGLVGKVVGGVGGGLICGTTGLGSIACTIIGSEIGDRVEDWIKDKISTNSRDRENMSRLKELKKDISDISKLEPAEIPKKIEAIQK